MLLPLTQTVERLRAKERTPFLPPEKGKDPKNPHRWRCPLVKDEDKIREELGRVARSKPRSGRGQQAKVTALRTLERLDQQPRKEPPPCPPDWHPQPGSVMEELDRADPHATPEMRRRLV